MGQTLSKLRDIRSNLRLEVHELKASLDSKSRLNSTFEAKFLRPFLVLSNRKIEAKVVWGRLQQAEEELLRLRKTLDQRKADQSRLKGQVRGKRLALIPKVDQDYYLCQQTVQTEAQSATLTFAIENIKHQNEIKSIRITELNQRVLQVQAENRELGEAVASDQGLGTTIALTLDSRRELLDAKGRLKIKSIELEGLVRSILAQKLLNQDLRLQVEWTSRRILLSNEELGELQTQTAETRELLTTWAEIEQVPTESVVRGNRESARDAMLRLKNTLKTQKEGLKLDMKKAAGIAKFRFSDKLVQSRARNDQLKAQLEELRGKIGLGRSLPATPNDLQPTIEAAAAKIGLEDKVATMNRLLAEREGYLRVLKEQRVRETNTLRDDREVELERLERLKTKQQREASFLADKLARINSEISSIEYERNSRLQSTQSIDEDLRDLEARKAALEQSIREKSHLLSSLEAQTKRLEAAARDLPTQESD